MALPHTLYRTLAALVLLGAVAAVCMSLGYWQLDRAAQRDAIKAAIDTGRSQPPVLLRAGMPEAELVPWRPAQATGQWRPELTVLLENRNHQGQPGYWVATPLVLDGPAQMAVTVLRGWLPRQASPDQARPSLPAIPPAQGQATVSGELLERVPRLFELWSWSGQDASQLPASMPASEGQIPVVQNLPLAGYAAATGLKFMPVVLAQTDAAPGAPSPASNTPFVREWPEPSLDSDKNRGYALQWFGFSAIAAIAWIVVLWRAIRRRYNEPNTL